MRKTLPCRPSTDLLDAYPGRFRMCSDAFGDISWEDTWSEGVVFAGHVNVRRGTVVPTEDLGDMVQDTVIPFSPDRMF